jgi:AcrR family transcriptional regulator
VARTVDPEAHARRRARIVAAAAAEFAEHGLEGTSTARICRRAGIGSGTLFHYFATKRAIFHAVFADDVPRVAALCAQAVAAPDPDTGLDLVVGHLVAEVTDPLAPGLAAAAYLEGGRDAEFGRLLAGIDDTRRAALTAILERLAALPGRRPAFPPAATARWIHGLVDAAHLGDAEDRDRTAAELRQIVDWLVGRGGTRVRARRAGGAGSPATAPGSRPAR